MRNTEHHEEIWLDVISWIRSHGFYEVSEFFAIKRLGFLIIIWELISNIVSGFTPSISMVGYHIRDETVRLNNG